jgi:surface carbohydrate biosynthesis protein
MRIALILNKPNREMQTMESVRREVLRLRPDAQVEITEMCRRGFKRDMLRFRPDAILTFPFTCVGFSRFFYVLKFLFKCRIVCFRAEGVISLHSEYNLNWAVGFDSYGNNLVDYEIFWGHGMAETVGKVLYEEGKLSSRQRAVVAGYPRLERYYEPERECVVQSVLPDRITDRFEQFGRRNIILFVTGFHLANYSRDDLINAGDLNAVEMLSTLEKGVELSRKLRADWCEQVVSTSRKHPEALLVLKKHPVERYEDYADSLADCDNILYIYEDLDIQDLMVHTGLFFHYGSTTLIDSYLSGVPSVYVYSEESRSWYSDLGWPSTRQIPIALIPDVVKDYLDGHLKFEMTQGMRKVMLDNFNINQQISYTPSRDIAAILVSDECPQMVPWHDTFLLKAFALILEQSVMATISTGIKRILNIPQERRLLQMIGRRERTQRL